MVKHIALLVALLSVALVPAARADKDKKYTLADLKALVDGKSFNEALEHLDDISPSERKADWEDLAGRAAVGAVDHAREPLQKLQLMIGIEEKFPSVVKHSKYNSVRTEVGPKGFAACFDASYDPGECRNFAIKFVDDDAANGKLALAMAKVARKGMFAYNSVPLFKRAVAANKGPAVCKDEDLKLATVAALGLPSDDEQQVDGRGLASSCWGDLRAPIIAALKEDDSGYTKTNVCEVLKARKEVRGEIVALCAP
jgi:hypothetical protein